MAAAGAVRTWLHGERGALLWLPALGAAAWLLLFALRVAPQGESLFTRMTGPRVAVLSEEGGDDAARGAAALRRRLVGTGDVAVVDSSRVAGRWTEIDRARATADSAFARTLWPQLAQLAACARFVREGDLVHGRLRVFDARAGRWILDAPASAAAPETVGALLADSLRAALVVPRALTAAAP